MNEDKKQKFEVYLLDVFLDESGWQENERFYLGTLDVDILAAMKNFRYRDYTGRQISALVTTDRRTVYAEDYYGDGSWWEIGAVKNRVPVYGLKLRGDAA